MINLYIKLFLETLDDPKVLKMPDWLFRRFIQFLLIAKENLLQHPEIQIGLLPPVEDMALRLRLKEEQIIEALEELRKKIGVATLTDQGWLITNFEKRQTYSESYERVKKFREKHKSDERYSNVTEIVTPINLTSLDSSSDSLNSGDSLTRWIEEFTGFPIPPTPENIKALDEMQALGATRADIEGAVAWWSKENKVARTPVQLLGSVKFQVGKRTQSRAKAPTAAPDAWINVTELRLAEEAEDA